MMMSGHLYRGFLWSYQASRLHLVYQDTPRDPRVKPADRVETTNMNASDKSNHSLISSNS